MTHAPYTGHDATFTATTNALAGVVQSISAISQDGGKLDITPLAGGDQKQFLPDDSFDGGEVEIELQVSDDTTIPALNSVDTFTCAMSGKTWTGSGIIIGREVGELKRGVVHMLKIKIALDGRGTPFTWTISS